MSDLKKQAEELGLKVDGRWSDDRLQEEIDKALAGEPQAIEKAPVPTMPVTLLYDYWFVEDVRTPAGETVDISVPDARALIAAGKAVRADPLPGE